MPPPLSYEPSVQALLSDVLPAGSRLLAGRAGLRRRVSWPVIARATGIGEIEGGEIILAPASRAREVVARIDDLAEIGMSAIVLALDAAPDWMERATPVPVVAVPSTTDLRRLSAEIERYISRRRRDLFALDQELHHALVDAAIAGASPADLLVAAAGRAQRPVALDRDGDVAHEPAEAPPPAAELLLQARIAAHAASRAAVEIDGPPRSLVMPVDAGRERRGLVLLASDTGAFTDEDEQILSALASGCAIALAREPDTPLPAVAEVIEEITLSTAEQGTATTRWTALAASDTSSTVRQIQRAVRAELSARAVRYVLALDGSAVVALVASSAPQSWPAITRSIASRMGTSDLRVALGRPYDGPSGAQRSTREALDTLPHASVSSLTTFAEIEVDILLRSTPRWREFARARLSPLLGHGQDERELLLTLRAYLASGRNAKAAAHALQVHRNTLLYRLRRIERLLDVELTDAETLFALELACRVAALYRDTLSAADDSG